MNSLAALVLYNFFAKLFYKTKYFCFDKFKSRTYAPN